MQRIWTVRLSLNNSDCAAKCDFSQKKKLKIPWESSGSGLAKAVWTRKRSAAFWSHFLVSIFLSTCFPILFLAPAIRPQKAGFKTQGFLCLPNRGRPENDTVRIVRLSFGLWAVRCDDSLTRSRSRKFDHNWIHNYERCMQHYNDPNKRESECESADVLERRVRVSW